MNENINTYYKEKVKEYIPNILNGQNEEEIIKRIFKVDDVTQIYPEHAESVREMIELYKNKIDSFFSEDKIERAIINNDGNLILASHELAKKLSELLQLPDQTKKSAEIYTKKAVNSCWTRNQSGNKDER